MSGVIPRGPRGPRWWKLRRNPDYAQWEWRERAALAAKLERAKTLVAEIGHNFESAHYGLAVIVLETMASSLDRMSRRWEGRAGNARHFAVEDNHVVDFAADKPDSWYNVWRARVHEDIAVDGLERVAAELGTAATQLAFAGGQRSKADHVLRLQKEVEEIRHRIIRQGDWPSMKRAGWE